MPDPIPYQPVSPDALINVQNALKTEGLQHIGTGLLAGAGLGAGIRGIGGLMDLIRRNTKKRKDPLRTSLATQEIQIPVMDDETDEDDEKQATPLPDTENRLGKLANAGLFQSKDLSTGNYEPRGIYGQMMGDNADSLTGIPWYIPGMGAAIGGGTYGGYKILDLLLKKRKEEADKEDLTDAKERYRNALINEYTPQQAKKEAAVADKLDQLYTLSEKTANAVSDMLGKAMGSYGLLAGGLALGSGIGAYNYVKKRSPEERLKKILEQRDRDRWLRHPPTIYAVPSPITVTEPKYPEDEDDEELNRKVAAFVDYLFNEKEAIVPTNPAQHGITIEQKTNMQKLLNLIGEIHAKARAK